MATVKTIDVQTLKQLMDQKPDLPLLDVRTPAEYESAHVRGARSYPLAQLNPGAFPKSGEPTYFICKAGVRSRQAAEIFAKAGFTEVISVEGGTDAWIRAGFPVERSGRKVLPLDRQMQITAGLIILAGTLLAIWHAAGLVVTGIVGTGLTMAGLTGTCPMAMLLAKMPWNQGCSSESCSLPGK